MAFVTFLALGLLLSLGAVIVCTSLDHTLRTPADIRERLGWRVPAVIPDVGERGPATRSPSGDGTAAKKRMSPQNQVEPTPRPRSRAIVRSRVHPVRAGEPA